MQCFSVKVPVGDEKAMEEFQEMMDKIHDETIDYTERLAEELDIPVEIAMDITYLRGRSRHTPELEQRLINAYRAGKPCPCVMQGEEKKWLEENGL